MDTQHVITALGGIAIGIMVCKLFTKESFEGVWDEPAPVDTVNGTVGPDTGPTIVPMNVPPTTYPPNQADFLLMNDAFDLSTATPLHPMPPYVVDS